jgi:hypothetical protein
MQSRSISRVLARAGIMVTAGVLALSGQHVAQAATTIDTWSSWDGCCTVQPFGHPDSSTYGQVITIPEGDKKLTQVTWYMLAGGVSGTLTYRSAIYTWDGSKAGEKVAHGRKKTLEVTAGDPEYQPSKTRFKKAKVEAGEQYVVFATISLDYETTDPGLSVIWPVTSGEQDVLPGGDFVFINDSGNEALWTTQPWVGIPFDNAFKAKLK